MKDIIFVSQVLEYPPTGGPQLRIDNTIKVLKKLTNIHLFNRDRSLNFYEYKKSFEYYKKNSLNYVDLINLYKEKNQKLKKIQIKFSTLFFNIFALKHALRIVDYARKKKINIIWVGFGNLSFGLIIFIKILYPKCKVIFDTDSVWSRYILREIPHANILRKLFLYITGNLKRFEEFLLTQICDITTAVSNIDSKYYKKFIKDKSKIKIFSNVIDLNSYKVDLFKSKIDSKYPSIFLAGSFGHINSPMDQAAKWMIEEVLPLIWKKSNKAKLYLIGRNADKSFKKYLNHKNILIKGKVDSVLPYLMHSNVSVVPLKFESGTRFKILEAAACNIPVVSTSLGAEGLNLAHNKEIIIADNAEQFAESIIELLLNKSKAKYISSNSRKIIEKYYSLNYLEREAKAILCALK